MNDLNIPHNKSPRIVIVGGGFGGLKLATLLRKKNFQIILIDKHNYHQFQPLLYQVATAGLEPSAISFPFRKIFQKSKNVHFRQTEVLSVNAEKKTIETTLGALTYDRLIIATGTLSNFFGNNVIKENCTVLKSVPDALYVRNQLLINFEKTVLTNNPKEVQALFNVVITGGGPTGVEVAGTIAEMKNKVLPKDYPDRDLSLMNIYLVEASSRLLSTFSEKSSEKAKKYLEKLGVKILLNAKVNQYDGKTVEIEGCENINTYNFLWTAGMTGNAPKGFSDNSFARGHRLKVDKFNQLEGYDDIYCIGDVAFVDGDKEYPNGHPQLAQVAIQQAKNIAANFKRGAKGKPLKPFKYRNLGIMATVGRNAAVVELHRIKFYGFFAWTIWMFVHLMAILGVKNKLTVFINWVYHYFTFDQSLRLIIKQEKEVD